MRVYAKVNEILRCPDELHLTAAEVAELTGHSAETVRQRKIKNFPAPLGQGRLLRWKLGAVRAWLKSPRATCAW